MSSDSTTKPTFGELGEEEMHAILARNQVGRIAYTFHDAVNIEPIHYVWADGVIYGRTAPGAKLRTIEHHRWVAFEVDEFEGLYDWRSVVVRGSVYVTQEGGSDTQRATHARALARLRTVVPELLTPDDPAPFRTVLFWIQPDRLTGRTARSR